MVRNAEGKTLVEFEPLGLAEQKLMEACQAGKRAHLGDKQPKAAAETNHIRSSFLRFLALGGDEKAPVHEHGIDVQGAWLDRDVDLMACKVTAPLSITDSWIEGDVMLHDAECPRLNLDGTAIMRLRGDRLQCRGSVHLGKGFHAKRGIRLYGAEIGGDLDCDGGKIENAGNDAMFCEGADVVGSVRLGHGFHSIGTVNFSGATVAGPFNCESGVSNPSGKAFVAFGSLFMGDVFLSNGFLAFGGIWFGVSTIRGSLYLNNGKFVGPSSKGAINEENNTFNASSITIEQGFVLENVTFDGIALNLTDSNIGRLADGTKSDVNTIDASSWPDGFFIDGCVYKRIAETASTDASVRIRWLKRQYPEHLKRDFRPQPWEYLVKVLREMGHPEQARKIAIAKQDSLRDAGKIRVWWRGLHWFYGHFARYGYEPERVVGYAAIVMIVCASLYSLGAAAGAIAPTNLSLLKDVDQPHEYRSFNALMYSLDLILPVVNLQQRQDWAPIVKKRDNSGALRWWPLGSFLRCVMWFEIIFGWVTSIVLVAMLSGLAKKD